MTRSLSWIATGAMFAALAACERPSTNDSGADVLDATAPMDSGVDTGADATVEDTSANDATMDSATADTGTDAASDSANDTRSDVVFPDVATPDGSFRMRLMAANLTAGNNQTYDVPPGDTAPGPGIRIMQGVDPDIVMLQEMRIGADDTAALQGLAESILGPTAYFCREMVDSRGDIPNGIVSRFPIRACGEWQDSRVSNRDYAYAQIDIPGPVDLWAISVHLHTNATSRPIEGMELVDNIRTRIPATDYVVVGGDLNTDTITEPIFATLEMVLNVTPLPTDQFGNPGTNTNRLVTLADGGLDPMRNQPYDHVMPSRSLYAHIVPVVMSNGTTTYTLPHGMVIDTRVFDATTIGMIAPARMSDSAALNMQHMGVIRDFVIPVR
ncbi:MAG: endonuclease/exonuclease/phosphatase family protein [Myxococcales bacterium]|nr:endonuclease/exonuclease/phosphatase family protein [Myxococcales bacterium]